MDKDDEIKMLREALKSLYRECELSYWPSDMTEMERARDALAQSQRAEDTPRATTGERLYVVFDGPPGPTSGRFVEVENQHGESVRAGEWEEHEGLWYFGPLFRTTQPPTEPTGDSSESTAGDSQESGEALADHLTTVEMALLDAANFISGHDREKAEELYDLMCHGKAWGKICVLIRQHLQREEQAQAGVPEAIYHLDYVLETCGPNGPVPQDVLDSVRAARNALAAHSNEGCADSGQSESVPDSVKRLPRLFRGRGNCNQQRQDHDSRKEVYYECALELERAIAAPQSERDKEQE